MNKYFYCANPHCLLKKSKQVITESFGELDGKRLCRACYQGGYRLKHGVIVYRRFIPMN